MIYAVLPWFTFGMICSVMVIHWRYQKAVIKGFKSQQQQIDALRAQSFPVRLTPCAMAEVELPPHVAELVAKGGKLTHREGPLIQDGEGRFHRDIEMLVDGILQGGFRVSWKGAGADLRLAPPPPRGKGMVN